MRSWFNCKIKYFREDEHGRMQKFNEAYLFDAVNYTEAEARVLQDLGEVIKTEFSVTNISKVNFVDIFNYDESEIWYKCKVTYKEYDEKSEKEKKVSQQMLIAADDLREAYDRLHTNLSEFLAEFSISSITETNIIDVYPYTGEENEIPDNYIPVEEYNEKVNNSPIVDEYIEEEEEISAGGGSNTAYSSDEILDEEEEEAAE